MRQLADLSVLRYTNILRHQSHMCFATQKIPFVTALYRALNLTYRLLPFLHEIVNDNHISRHCWNVAYDPVINVTRHTTSTH